MEEGRSEEDSFDVEDENEEEEKIPLMKKGERYEIKRRTDVSV